MLKASEFLIPSQCFEADSRVLRGLDLEFLTDKVPARFGKLRPSRCSLDSLRLISSEGQVRVQHMTGGKVCLVEALRAHARENPHWLILLPLSVRGRDRGSLGKVFRKSCAWPGWRWATPRSWGLP